MHIIFLGITCPTPPNIVNGTIGYSPLGTTEVFKYGRTATYQCNPGYIITSVDRVRTCTGDGSTSIGQWDGTAPQCPRMFYIIALSYVIVVTHARVPHGIYWLSSDVGLRHY